MATLSGQGTRTVRKGPCVRVTVGSGAFSSAVTFGGSV